MRVAVIGARGIGKHHAHWFYRAGCEIVGFLGTTPQSCQQTEQQLQRLFPFRGKGFWDYDRLLTEVRPDIICICSPHHLHVVHALRALQAGAHVYCEKPLHWVPPERQQQPAPAELERLISEAEKPIQMAKRAGLLLAMNLQYVAALPYYETIYQQIRGPLERIDQVFVELESRGSGGQPNRFAGIWGDLGSHPLSQLLAWYPTAKLDPTSIECTVRHSEVTARFRYGTAQIEIQLRNISQGVPLRRFGLNGLYVDYTGRPDQTGLFESHLRWPEGEQTVPDFMRQSVETFVATLRGRKSQVLVDGEAGLRNLILQVELLKHATWGSC